MSDNLRRYRAIRDALTQGYPGTLKGHVARHLTPLAALISGIVGSKSTQLPNIAAKVPNGTKPDSRVKRFARWVDNAHILEEVYFLPYADVLLRHLAWQTLVSLKAEPSRWLGGCATPPRGTFPQSSISPWSSSSAGCSQRGRRWCCWAMGNSMGRGCSKRCSRWAGPTRAVRP